MSLEEIKAALAGRYEVEREIGQGGMATVYLAFDPRHERQVAIKVLRPHVAAGVGAGRFLREIKIAASLSHPNIIPLHDSGEINGLVYSVMPYVEGESLRQRLEREGLLPLEDALAIAQQVAAALAYAHSRGIVHRDIKPDNILLSSGQAVVADFGLARALEVAGGATELTGAGIAVGTPAYMSPEQARGDTEIDARADQYSLGCVLFEMLAGEPPFPGRSIQSILVRQMTESAPSLSDMREIVPPHVAEAVRKALAKTPADRFAAVAQFADAIRPGTPTPVPAPVAPVRAPRRALRWIAPSAVVLVIMLLVLFVSALQPVEFARRDWIVVADFENTTGDTVFDGTLDRAFAIGLEQSKHVNVFPRSGMVETLRFMGVDTATVLTGRLAQNVALRRGIRVIVRPTIGRVGRTYALGISVIDPQTDAVLLSRGENAEGEDEVLAALDKLTRRLRRDLGESLASVWNSGVRLDAATTPSLDALKAWSAGNRQWRENNYEAAADLYRRAIAFDSSFAMAHNDLGQYYYWVRNDPRQGDAAFEKALGFSDRVTHRERLTIQATSAGWRGDGETAISTLRTLLAEYPDDGVSWSNLGYQYLRLARWEGAIEAYGRAIDVDSLDHNSMINLATVYNSQHDYERALVWYERAFEVQPSYRINLNLNYEFGFLHVARGDYRRAEEVFSWMLTESREHRSRGHRSMALLRMRQGRYAQAIDHLRQAVVLSEVGGGPTTTLRNRGYLAAALITAGHPGEARRELAAMKRLADTAGIAPEFLAPAARLMARAGMLPEAAAMRDSVVGRSRPGNAGHEAAALMARGEVALAEGRIDSARALLERANVLDVQPQPLYLEGLGLALTALEEDEAAREVFERIVDIDVASRESQEPWILARYRLGLLYEAAAQPERAVEWYSGFLDLWKEADEDLQPVIDARRRLAALTQTDRPGG